MIDMSAEIPTNEGVKSAEPKKDATPRAFLVYRDNDFYHKAIPTLVEQLRASGVEVGVVSFPAGTSQAKIKLNLKEREEDFGEAILWTDGTIDRSWAYPRYKELKSRGTVVNPAGGLDNRFDQSVLLAIGKEATEEPYFMEDVETYGMVFRKLLSIAFTNKKPDKIIIRPDELETHEPFYRGRGRYYGTPQDNVKKWIEEAGYPSENIITPKRGYGEIPPGSTAWIIVDRHVFGDNKRPGNSTPDQRYLRLPLISFFDDLMEDGLINRESVPLEKLSNFVAKGIQTDFEKVNTKKAELEAQKLSAALKA